MEDFQTFMTITAWGICFLFIYFFEFGYFGFSKIVSQLLCICVFTAFTSQPVTPTSQEFALPTGFQWIIVTGLRIFWAISVCSVFRLLPNNPCSFSTDAPGLHRGCHLLMVSLSHPLRLQKLLGPGNRPLLHWLHLTAFANWVSPSPSRTQI